MAYQGTDGDDVIVINTGGEVEASGETDIEALGGDDLVIFDWSHFVRQTEDDPFELNPADWHVDGGSGQDTLEFRLSGDPDEHPAVVLDPRTGNLEGLTFESVERFRLIGGSQQDELYGLDGNDLLMGAGGSDVMAGGAGGDTYLVQQSSDEVIENENEGIDTLRSTIRFTLPANVENLVLLDNPTNVADLGRGNALDNEITGNSRANELEGLDGDDVLDGGTNADILRGGRGDDVYIVDHPSDSVREIDGALGGIDSVRSSVSFTLGDFTENLVLLTGAANATGNMLANQLTGNSSANRLDGRAGADTMRGLGGDDTYVVDNAGDRAIEVAGGGRDGVLASVSYRIGAYVEKLTLTGSAAIDGNGNSGHNVISGNSAANTLIGEGGNDTIRGGTGDDRIFGGRGNDSLRGEGGTDRFYFDTPLSASSNVDDLINFTPADDWVLLDQSIFSGIANGVLSAAAFRLGTTALDASDRILYDQPTGRIFYDADGAGGAAAILFATVPDGAPVTQADFYVYG